MLKSRSNVERNAAVLLATVAAFAMIAPLLAPHPAETQFRTKLFDANGLPAQPFSTASHWLGGDALGRDMGSVLLHAAQPTLLTALTAALFATAFAVVAGFVAGWHPGWPDRIVSFAIDYFLALPAIVVLITIRSTIRELQHWQLALLLGSISWIWPARLVRTRVQEIRSQPFVEAALAMGSAERRIFFRSVLPNMRNLLASIFAVQVAHMLLYESALSYLGLAASSTVDTWGVLLRQSGHLFMHRPHLMVLPGSLIVLSVVVFVWFGKHKGEHEHAR